MINTEHYQDTFLARLIAGGATPENQVALSLVEPNDFSYTRHIIYTKAASIVGSTGEVSLELILSDLETSEAMILINLVRDWGSSGSALGSAKAIVKARKLLNAKQLLAEMANRISSINDANWLVDEITALNDELSVDVEMQMPKLIGDIIPEFVEDIEQRHEGTKELGIKIGIPTIDENIGHILMTDVIVIGGAPGWGKTEFALKCLSSVSLTYDRPTLAFTLEMSEQEIAQRLIAIEGDIRGGAMRDPRGMEQSEWTGMTSAIAKLQDSKIYIDDKADVSIDEIIAKTKMWKQKHPDIAAIMIDYIQNVTLGKFNTRVEAINDASRRLKALAKEINCPIFLVSQMNREWSKRGSKEPNNQDLAEGSGLERDASIILFPYRDTEAGVTDGNSDLAKIITGKNRANEKKDWVMEWRDGHFYETKRSWGGNNCFTPQNKKPSYI